MTPAELLAHFRTEAHDTKRPYLWDDAEAMRYMNLAYTEWVRLTGGLRDDWSDMTRLVLPAATASVELDRRILRVLQAKLATDSRPLRVINDDHPDAKNTRVLPGVPRTLVFGGSESRIRPIDVPVADTTVILTVRRLPLETITKESDAFEIREEQTEFLVYGMLYRAYAKDDPDTYDKQRSDRHKGTFEMEAKRCKAESEGANHVRGTVQYGGL